MSNSIIRIEPGAYKYESPAKSQLARQEAIIRNLQRVVTELLDDRREPCPHCGIARVEARR